MIKVLLVNQDLPVAESDFKLLCVYGGLKVKTNVYVNTRWIADYWKTKQGAEESTEKLLIAELESTDNLEETLANWFSEDAIMVLKNSKLNEFLEFYQLIQTPDFLVVLEEERDQTGVSWAYKLLVNELDLLLRMDEQK